MVEVRNLPKLVRGGIQIIPITLDEFQMKSNLDTNDLQLLEISSYNFIQNHFYECYNNVAEKMNYPKAQSSVLLYETISTFIDYYIMDIGFQHTTPNELISLIYDQYKENELKLGRISHEVHTKLYDNIIEMLSKESIPSIELLPTSKEHWVVLNLFKFCPTQFVKQIFQQSNSITDNLKLMQMQQNLLVMFSGAGKSNQFNNVTISIL